MKLVIHLLFFLFFVFLLPESFIFFFSQRSIYGALKRVHGFDVFEILMTTLFLHLWMKLVYGQKSRHQLLPFTSKGPTYSHMNANHRKFAPLVTLARTPLGGKRVN